MDIEQYKLILDITTEGFWDWDLKTDRAYLSPRYCELVGYSPEDTVFDSAFFKSIIHPDDQEYVFKVIGEYLQGKRDISIIEYRMISKDGSVHWIEGRGKAVEFDEIGAPSRMVGTIVDISQRKKSDENYHTLISNLPGLVVAHFDRDLRHQSVNDNIEDITGMPRESLIGKTNRELGMPGHLVQFWENSLKEVFGSGQPKHIEFSYPSPNGQLYFESQLVPELSTDGKINTVISITLNITECKQAREIAFENERTFHNLFNNTEIPLFRTRLDGSETLLANDKFLQLVGRTRDEVIGRPSIDYWVDPRQREQMVCRLKADGRVVDYEFKMLNKNGQVRDCLTSLNLYPEEGLLDGSILDITEREQLVTSLKESEFLFKESQRAAAIGSYKADFVAGRWDSSEIMDQIFGIDKSYDKTIQNWLALIYPDDKEMMDRFLMEEVLSKHSHFNKEYRIIRKSDGEIRWVAGLGELNFDAEGNVISMIGTIQDITERKHLEDKLHQSLKLESVGRLAGGVAHDFNNKLTVILGYAELLKLKYPDNQDLQEKLNEISKAAEHSRDITGQLLTFSRRQIISPKSINPNAALKDTQRTLPRLIGEDITLTYALANGLSNIMMDPVQFDQIIMNLAVNSRDAMPNGGEITISTANTTIDNEQSLEEFEAIPGGYILLTFSDTGQGMDAETRKHIFEPFFTTKEVGKGTGLGLATIYGIVKQNNGYITVNSEMGQGTTFRIYLPCMEEKAIPTISGVKEQLKGTGTILVVEDDEIVRKITAGSATKL